MNQPSLSAAKKSTLKIPKVVTIDFETEGIEGRPKYPPIPAGFSILKPGQKKSKYYAWGHPCENNCTFDEARRALLEVWESDLPLLFHNSKFDVDVAETHMKMPPIRWERVHDTLFLLFLHDPHAISLSLKPAAERLLGVAPEERDAVKDWVLAHIPEAKKKPSTWGAYICKAPGKLVGTYADGDVTRTKALFDLLYCDIHQRSMGPAYDRERRLMKILLANEREGVCADLDAMKADHTVYLKALETADKWLRKRLKQPDLNIDSDADLAKVLDREGIVTDWVLTKTGKKSTAKGNMTPDRFNDPKVAAMLGFRGRLTTCVGTFLEPWIRMAETGDGRIFTNWNQVRQSHGNDGFAGARTGRMSCNPNFMNIPKQFEESANGYQHPRFLKSLPPLPLMRRYITADPGEVFLHRDYSQQELRILAHFEDGDLLRRYNETPRMDVHDLVQRLIKDITGHEYGRKPVKIINFGKVYGMGVGKLAIAIESTVEDAKRLSDAHKKALPGVKELEKGIKEHSKAGHPIVTWGGRQYFCEEPRMIQGRMCTFEYKLLNYLIQGSAADCTKEAIIRYDETKQHGRFLVTVHDELNVSAPKKYAKAEMAILREAMESIEFGLPMLSDGESGSNWADLTAFQEKK